MLLLYLFYFVVVLCVKHSLSSSTGTTTLVEKCLSAAVPPPTIKTTCSPEWAPSGCLKTRIPAWKNSTYSRVMACFRCCMLAETQWENVDALVAENMERLLAQSPPAPGAVGKRNGVLPRESAMFGHNSDIRFSELSNIYGNPPYDTKTRIPSSVDWHLVLLGGGYAFEVEKVLRNPSLRMNDRMRVLKGAPSNQLVVSIIEDLDQPSKETERYLFSVGNRPNITRLFVTNPRPDILLHGAKYPDSWQARVFPYPRGVSNTSRWIEHFGRSPRAEELQVSRADSTRTNLLFCGCMHMWPWRKQAIERLTKNGFKCISDSENCNQYEDLMLTSKFVFSPRGHGWQSFRDWEALLCGAIVLVDAREGYHDAIWAGLPIVEVTDWLQVTPAYLEGIWSTFQQRDDFDWSKIYFPYWWNLIRYG